MRVGKELEMAVRASGHPTSQQRKKGRCEGITNWKPKLKPAMSTCKLQESHTHPQLSLVPPPCSLLCLPASAVEPRLWAAESNRHKVKPLSIPVCASYRGCPSLHIQSEMSSTCCIILTGASVRQCSWGGGCQGSDHMFSTLTAPVHY